MRRRRWTVGTVVRRAALAVAACVLVLIAFGRRDGDPSIATASASDSTVPAVAAAAVATDVVTVDPAAYLGRTEADALATLAAAGLTAVTTPDGRFTALMPHPERVLRPVQVSWFDGDLAADGPWLRMFRNARVFVG